MLAGFLDGEAFTSSGGIKKNLIWLIFMIGFSVSLFGESESGITLNPENYHMAKGISETAFSSQVEDLLKTFHWRWVHFRPAWSERGYRTPIRGGDPDGYKGKGFVDYCAVRNGLCLFIELKDDKAKLPPAQEAWGKDLQAVAEHSLGVMYFCWRPNQLETEIIEILR